MPTTNTESSFLSDCEPYFLDGVHTIAEIVRRTQELIRSEVDRKSDVLLASLKLTAAEVSFRDYCTPDKLWKVKPPDEIQVGTCFGYRDVFEGGVFRYWGPNEKPGIGAYLWLADRSQGTALGQTIEELPDPFPDPAEVWDSEIAGCRYSFWREISNSEFTHLASLLDELIAYLSHLLNEVGGVRRFLN